MAKARKPGGMRAVALPRAALAYARRGVPVFPCEPGGKRPLTANGHWDATTDERVIRSWWGRWPSANVAIPTGRASDLVVLDADAGAGLESIGELELTVTGQAPKTRPGGGEGGGPAGGGKRKGRERSFGGPIPASECRKIVAEVSYRTYKDNLDEGGCPRPCFYDAPKDLFRYSDGTFTFDRSHCNVEEMIRRGRWEGPTPEEVSRPPSFEL